MLESHKPHPLYTGATEVDPETELVYEDGDHGTNIKKPIRFQMKKPDGPDGKERDQTSDAADHMRYAAALGLPELKQRQLPRLGRAVIVGGAPSIKDHLETIVELAADPLNAVLAVNWSHTWLIENGVVPDGAVFFEIDAEPDSVLKAIHPDVTYYICSHCHQKSFDALAGFKRVLWHSPPNSTGEEKVGEELFKGSLLVGGGISTFSRTMSIALHLGYRHLDLFGCDSSFPDDGKTHVDGYETVMDAKTDGMYVYAQDDMTKEVRRFKTLGYLALQNEEFKEYCRRNHQHFSCRVHGDSLLRFTHERMWPDQYNYGS
jgi:hypothetical protein